MRASFLIQYLLFLNLSSLASRIECGFLAQLHLRTRNKDTSFMPTEPQPFSNDPRLIVILSICTSLIISWLYSLGSHVLSPDSLLYIFTAQTFLDHGLQAAIESYPWPLLSLSIAGIHQLTGLSLVVSGHLFIAALYAGLSCTFVLLIRDLGGSSRTQLLALLVISIFPTLNDYRDYITRDAGFWLLTLLSLQQLLRFALNNHFKHALGWFFLTLAAIGFRTEAIFFAALAPLALLFDSHLEFKERVKKACFLYGLLSCVALLALVAIFISPQLSAKFRLITEIANLSAFFQSLAQGFEYSVERFARVAPHEFAANDMGAIIGTGLIGLIIYTLLHALTFPYLLLLSWQPKQPLFSDARYKHYLIAFLLIIFLYLLLFSFKQYFMTDRFCIAAVLVLMLALPFRIENIWQSTAKQLGWQRITIVFLLLIPALDSLISSGSSKEYIANAADWVQKNKPSNVKLLTNQKHIAVLGANCWNQCIVLETSALIIQAKSQQPELLAIRLKNKETQQVEEIHAMIKSGKWQLTQTFSNEKDDKVLILSSPRQVKTSVP